MEYHVERLWRDARLLEIGGGTNEALEKNITKDLEKTEYLIKFLFDFILRIFKTKYKKYFHLCLLRNKILLMILFQKPLEKYIVDQDYSKYTFEDQSVWRYIMKQLKSFLAENAHSSYLEGLEKTGITIDQIPRISDMSEKLQKLGWKAVPVSGFIPPAVFMEFQVRHILPIATAIRTVDHISYTPAPDIVHEAAGHAPFLVHPVFNSFLKEYGKVVRKAITNKQDFEQYSAIRRLSVYKRGSSFFAGGYSKGRKATRRGKIKT